MSLINTFKEQNRDTIWEQMSKLTSESDVFSTWRMDIIPHFTWNLVYVFGRENEMVIVLIDSHDKGDDVLADEEKFTTEMVPQYFSQSDHWMSPAYYVQLVSHAIREVCRNQGTKEPLIHGVVITNTNIINLSDMQERWDWLGITMIDNADVDQTVATRNNYDTPMGEVFSHFVKNRDSVTWELDSAHEHVLDEKTISLFEENQANEESADSKGSAKDGKEEECTNNKESNGTEEKKNVIICDDDYTIEVPLPSYDSLRGVEVIMPLLCPQRALKRLIGLDSVKKKLQELAMFTQYNCMLKSHGAKTHNINLHSIFYGNPGTGKTTVGRIYASLLREAGLLQKGHVVHVNGRQAFVGRMFGDEESAVEKLIELAEGGILFIDEAYTLNGNHNEDPGKMVLPLLMKMMADEKHRDIAVVLAGYQKPLEELLALNAGLDSRFPKSNRFCFPDFSPEELLQIAKNRLNYLGYKPTSTAWKRLKTIIDEGYHQRNPENFGNGRYVANLLEDIFLRHAIRCVEKNIEDLEKLHHITVADVAKQKENAFNTKATRHIGFV